MTKRPDSEETVLNGVTVLEVAEQISGKAFSGGGATAHCYTDRQI